MTSNRMSILAGLLALLVLQSTPGVAFADCAAEAKKTHRLKFKVKDDQCVVRVLKADDDADADTINTSECDTVVWQVSGPKKSIVFEGTSPFDWVDSGPRGGKIEGLVRSGAAKDGQSTSYKYSVTVEGQACVFDPRIIVDP